MPNYWKVNKKKGRPRKRRQVEKEPAVTSFNPLGVPDLGLEYVVITVDELEALRLADYLEMTQEEVAQRVQVSRPTVTRMLAMARRALADALVNGKGIHIHGGTYQVSQVAEKAADSSGQSEAALAESPFFHQVQPMCI